MNYTITLTEVQDKALKHVAYDPQDWIENFVYERCRLAIEEISLKEFEKSTKNGSSISGTKEEIVLAADIKTAKEIQDELNAQESANLLSLEQQQAAEAEAAQQEEERLVRESYENL